MEGKYLQILLIVILPIIIILGTTLQVSSDSNFFNKQITSLEIINPTYVTIGVAGEITTSVVDYLKGDNELDEELLGIRAKEHMKDVKNIRDISFYVLWIITLLFIVGILILILTKRYERIPKILFGGGLIAAIINLLVFIFANQAFGTLWTSLHEVLFTNDLWILNPATDPLVATFTLNFFIIFLKRILLISTILALILAIIGIIWMLVTKKEAKIHHLEIDKPKEHQW
ncbi:DUF1461 domain-containing protein [Candidatus Woesearchaeota archaeon]|jgi:integral membrane protein (TIGR01906 family)|nr:DUF1461 domain-containing protein [Candidatus Woesearchaeota archaeon]MBT6045153.1 DUF1461 domain-containing protein [Candidatus Woesearchaeota archaeon]